MTSKPKPKRGSKMAVRRGSSMAKEHVELLVEKKLAEIAAEQRTSGLRLTTISDDFRSLAEIIKGGPGGEGLDKTVLRHGEALARVEASVDSLKHAVLGNGQAGIAERLRDHERRWQVASRLMWIAITAVAGGVVGLAFKVFE